MSFEHFKCGMSTSLLKLLLRDTNIFRIEPSEFATDLSVDLVFIRRLFKLFELFVIDKFFDKLV